MDKPSVSLSEVHRSVDIPKNVGLFKRLFAFAGPAYLVSVGYMDPGNWATDLEGGARFGYQLLWVIVMSNMMAILLQTLSARLGIVTGRDLAQACRENYPPFIGYILWILCEVAIAACDLAEVLGTAIGLNLLFHIPLLYGVIITGFDTILILVIQQFGIRKIEAFIIMLIGTMGICFGIELFLAKPDISTLSTGLIPHINADSLYIAIGIIGATVMPHNLYLHSALVQTRLFEQTDEAKKIACKYNFIDTAIALNGALFVNAAILILAASTFFKNGIVVTEIQQAYELLTPLLGTAAASTLFAVALLASGQSSTLTGTLAGQIVMEGFLNIRIRPWVRRLITRSIAIVPAVIVIALKGDQGSYGLLILSQVILSLQLSFAVIPLIKFTSDKSKMGPFVNKLWVKILAWITAVIIIVLNVRLVIQTLWEWIQSSEGSVVWIWIIIVPLVVFILLLLIYIALPDSWRKKRKEIPVKTHALELRPAVYQRIGVAIDHTATDSRVLAHALSLARINNAEMILFHIVEGVAVQLFGKEADDKEVRSDETFLHDIARQLQESGTKVQPVLGYGKVAKELVRLSIEHHIDLLVMGGHRHHGAQDLIFGTSISKVRHQLSIPVLIV